MEISELAPLVLIDSKNVKRDLEDLTEDQIENQKANKIMHEAIDPLMDQTEDLKDSSWDQTEKNAISEIENRVANKNGRFPCKYCNQTFSKNIYVMSHEKKSCKKRKSNKTKKI